MAKYYGKIGYAKTIETTPGVWIEKIIEKPYYGDLAKSTRKLSGGNSVNSDINVANEISIVADPFAFENFFSMRYITFMGCKWKIKSVEVLPPRLILEIGDIYNETSDGISFDSC